MKIVICGGRDFRDWDYLEKVCDMFHTNFRITAVAHGGARGADELGGAWAGNRGLPVTVFKADWNRHGPSAGPIRNRRMLDEFKPNYVLAFKGGRGTADCVKAALERNINIALLNGTTPIISELTDLNKGD